MLSSEKDAEVQSGSSRPLRHVDVQVEMSGDHATEDDARVKIAMVGTVQFIAALQGLKEDLEKSTLR